MSTSLQINPQRMQSDFNTLAAIGATAAGGVNRPALSPAHLEARAWFVTQVLDAGLALRVDGAGNHSAILGCANASAPTLLLGSHLDSVPNGGRYDGALGVVAALEKCCAPSRRLVCNCLFTWRRSISPTKRALWSVLLAAVHWRAV